MILAYTAIAFLLGYIINTLSSWLEDFYFFTWRGNPSQRLLEGKDVWKVRFYQSEKAKSLLLKEWGDNVSTNHQLFSIAMRHANGNSRTDDFNAMYAFSRSLLTTVFVGTIILLIENYDNWKYYACLFPLLIMVWLRCKQRAYYYAREVLNEYLKLKDH